MAVIFNIQRQEAYSRKELLLRTLFGAFYLVLPHAIALFFVSALGSLLLFLTFWSILFTKRYPERWCNWFVEQMRWDTRITTYLLFMSTDYPPFTGKEIH